MLQVVDKKSDARLHPPLEHISINYALPCWVSQQQLSLSSSGTLASTVPCLVGMSAVTAPSPYGHAGVHCAATLSGTLESTVTQPCLEHQCHLSLTLLGTPAMTVPSL